MSIPWRSPRRWRMWLRPPRTAGAKGGADFALALALVLQSPWGGGPCYKRTPGQVPGAQVQGMRWVRWRTRQGVREAQGQELPLLRVTESRHAVTVTRDACAGARRLGASMRWRRWWIWARSRWTSRARAAPRSASSARRRRTARCAQAPDAPWSSRDYNSMVDRLARARSR